MGLGSIDFLLGMCMPGSGEMGTATGVECIHVRTEAGMLGSSSRESSMGLGITISGKTIGSFLCFAANLINSNLFASFFWQLDVTS